MNNSVRDGTSEPDLIEAQIIDAYARGFTAGKAYVAVKQWNAAIDEAAKFMEWAVITNGMGGVLGNLGSDAANKIRALKKPAGEK